MAKYSKDGEKQRAKMQNPKENSQKSQHSKEISQLNSQNLSQKNSQDFKENQQEILTENSRENPVNSLQTFAKKQSQNSLIFKENLQKNSRPTQENQAKTKHFKPKFALTSVFVRFISAAYLKAFFILFMGLNVFFVGIDLIINFKDLPNSANLALLYVLFLSFVATSYVLPLSIVFAMLWCFLQLIRSNELVSLYALGLSRRSVIAYPFLWAFVITLIYVGLNFTPFAYASDYQSNILADQQLGKQSKDIFMKFDNKFIYISEMKSLDESVENMKIFDINGSLLSAFFDVKNAVFKDGKWLLKSGEMALVPQNPSLHGQGLIISNIENVETLSGFKPRIIESVANQSSYSITDALNSIFAFDKEGVSTTFMRVELYKMLVTPFFAPFLLLIIYRFIPAISRFYSIALIGFCAALTTTIAWGILYLTTRFAQNGLLSPEVAMILPVFLMMVAGVFLNLKREVF